MTAPLAVAPGASVAADGPVAAAPAADGPPAGGDAARRRFTRAALTGTILAAVPFVWFLFGVWQDPDPLRKTAFEDNFYDLQARAMFHGHLWLANGAVGIEAFIHAGRQYTYFGLFPSIIRMPVLLVTSRLDGRLTVLYMLVAWMLTALFSSLLAWRVRILIRGPVAMGRAEATSFGVLIAALMVGSVWTVLGSLPYVFAEDLAWSICLTVGSVFCLLGVLERPTWGRVVASLVLVLCANLDRLTTGWACVVGAVLIAAWFGLGKGGEENRRWCVPLLAVGLVPLAVGCYVNYLKFGVPFGLPVGDQVYTLENAYRRKFLAANHGSEEGLAFIPSDFLAYLRLDGIRFSSVFPFVTLPATPAEAVHGVLFDRRYRTASVTASMPLMSLLSCWGLVTAFRPRPVGKVALTRILLLASGSAGAALLLWGYIAPRYLADFMPFLTLASAVALVDIWRRMEGRSRRFRRGGFAVIALVGAFTIWANFGIGVAPDEEWTTAQVSNYVSAQDAFSDITGHPLNAEVVRADSLPTFGPAGQLYIIGACDGLYISNGEDYSTVPEQQFVRTTWMPVEYGHLFEHTYVMRALHTSPGGTAPVPLVSSGPSTVSLITVPSTKPGEVAARFVLSGQGRPPYSSYVALMPIGSMLRVSVVTDPAKHYVEVLIRGHGYLSDTMYNIGPIVAHPIDPRTGGATLKALQVTDVTASTPPPSLCLGLR